MTAGKMNREAGFVRPQPAMARRRLLGAVAAGGLAAVGALTVVRPTTARAAVAPRVYTRTEWGARPPSTPVEIIGAPDHIVVHHTASDNTPDLSLDQAFALSHWIQGLHMDTNGWIDAGQQLTISRGGYVLEGRDRSLEAVTSGLNVLGAQTANHNSHTIGIENEGIYVSENPTSQLFESLVQTCAWLCAQYGLDPNASIVGHRDYVNTQCPGDVFYARLPELRDRVAGALA